MQLQVVLTPACGHPSYREVQEQCPGLSLVRPENYLWNGLRLVSVLLTVFVERTQTSKAAADPATTQQATGVQCVLAF